MEQIYTTIFNYSIDLDMVMAISNFYVNPNLPVTGNFRIFFTGKEDPIEFRFIKKDNYYWYADQNNINQIIDVIGERDRLAKALEQWKRFKFKTNESAK